MAWPDHFAKGAFISLHLSPRWLLCRGLGHIILSKVSLRFFIFICLPHHCFARRLGQIMSPKACCHVFSLPRWVLCWVAWPGHFATCLLSFLCPYIPDDCFAGWLGMLPKVSFNSFPQVFALRWMAWPDHFARDLLLCVFACVPLCCFCAFSFHACRRWLLCWMAWPDHFARGLHWFLLIWLSDACLGLIYFLRVFLPLSSLWDWRFHVFGLPDICLRADPTTGRRLLVSKACSDS